jgi:hypothetical protein
MTTMVRYAASAQMGSNRAHDGTSYPAPIYIVCSPNRRVGKTLLARLLTEYYSLGRDAIAFDFADEGPQLADYLPQFTKIIDIGDIRGQMAFFDRLVVDSDIPKIIDLSHRAFRNFFTVVHQIGFFVELRRRSIEAFLLFMVDPDPRSAHAYAMLRRWFTEASLLPVRNGPVAKGVPYSDAFASASPMTISLEIPMLSPSIKSLVDQKAFSFAEFRRGEYVHMPRRLQDDMQAWVNAVFLQFREIELCLLSEQILASLQ